MLLAVCYWLQGRTELFDEHADRAAALVADQPPSRPQLAVLMRRAARASIAGDIALALELNREALQLSDELGWEEGSSTALGQLGLARVEGGDPGGFDELGRAVEIAKRLGAFGVLSRLSNTLSVAYQVSGDMNAAYDARRQGAEVAERLGADSQVRWFEAPLIDHRYRVGEWTEAAAAADRYAEGVESGSSRYAAWQVVRDPRGTAARCGRRPRSGRRRGTLARARPRDRRRPVGLVRAAVGGSRVRRCVRP